MARLALYHCAPQLPADPAGQARHLTVLVHRLQSRAGEDVLGELATCAASAGQEAWDANFSKVRPGGGGGRALVHIAALSSYASHAESPGDFAWTAGTLECHTD